MLLSTMRLTRHLHALLARCQDLFADLHHPYRPELHYMRGPGPKWHAKHRCL